MKKPSVHSFTRKVMSALLGVTMLFNSVSFPAFAEDVDDFYIGDGLTYNASEGVYEIDGTDFGSYFFEVYWADQSGQYRYHYDWDAYSTERNQNLKREVKLVLQYNSNQTDNTWYAHSDVSCYNAEGRHYDDYPDMWFELEGIAHARRGASQAPVIGANSNDFDYCKSMSDRSNREYNLDNDTLSYYMTKDLRTLNGGLTMVWDYQPREMIDGYSKALSPIAYVKIYNDDRTAYKVVKVNLPDLQFDFQSEKDNVYLDVDPEQQDNFDHGDLDQGYYWKRVRTTFDMTAKTRPLSDTDLYIEIPKSDVDMLLDSYEKTGNTTDGGEVYLSVLGSYINLQSDPRVEFDGVNYRVKVDYDSVLDWSTNSSRTALDINNGEVNVYLGIKKQTADEIAKYQADLVNDYIENLYLSDPDWSVADIRTRVTASIFEDQARASFEQNEGESDEDFAARVEAGLAGKEEELLNAFFNDLSITDATDGSETRKRSEVMSALDGAIPSGSLSDSTDWTVDMILHLDYSELFTDAVISLVQRSDYATNEEYESAVSAKKLELTNQFLSILGITSETPLTNTFPYAQVQAALYNVTPIAIEAPELLHDALFGGAWTYDTVIRSFTTEAFEDMAKELLYVEGVDTSDPDYSSRLEEKKNALLNGYDKTVEDKYGNTTTVHVEGLLENLGMASVPPTEQVSYAEIQNAILKMTEILMDVNSHLIREYEEESAILDRDIAEQEQGDVKKGDRHFDTEQFNYITQVPDPKPQFSFTKQIVGGSGPYGATALVSGNTMVSYTLGCQTKNFTDDYNLYIADDKLLIMLDLDSNDTTQYDELDPYRILDESEYYVASLTMPKYVSSNGIDADGKSYDYIIYDVNSLGVRTQLQTGNTASNSVFSFPENAVHNILIEICNVDKSISYKPQIDYIYKLDDNLGFRSGLHEYSNANATLYGDEYDPYGKLVNFGSVYAVVNENEPDQIYYGDSNWNTNYPSYKDSNHENYAHDEPVGVDDGGTDVYVFRSSAVLKIHDPMITLRTGTSYSPLNTHYLIDLTQYGRDGKTKATSDTKEAAYYSAVNSTAVVYSDRDAAFSKIVVETVIPVELTVDYAHPQIKAISGYRTIKTIDGESFEVNVDNSDLLNYMQTSTSLRTETISGKQCSYRVVTQEFLLPGNFYVKGEVEASITLQYPVTISYVNAESWKSSENYVPEFYAETVERVTPLTNSLKSSANKTASHLTYENSDMRAATSEHSAQLPPTASSWNEKAVKEVISTVYGSNKNDVNSLNYGNSAKVNFYEVLDEYTSEQTESAEKCAEYTYRLEFSMGNAAANKLVFYDNLEQASGINEHLGSNVPESEWISNSSLVIGTLKSVNIGYADNDTSHDDLNTNIDDFTGMYRKLKATVYYRTSTFETTLYQPTNLTPDNQEEELDSNWIEAGEYTGSLGDVKAIAVVVEPNDAIPAEERIKVVAPTQELYFTITMQAPDLVNNPQYTVLKDQTNYNNFSVRYSRVNTEGYRTDNEIMLYPNIPINSDYTAVTLSDKLIQMTIVKTDGQDELQEIYNDGVLVTPDTKYAFISGAEFEIYRYTGDRDNPRGTVVHNEKDDLDYFTADEQGKISLTLPVGSYVLVEKTVPQGYESIGDVLAIVTPGGVTAKKLSSDEEYDIELIKYTPTTNADEMDNCQFEFYNDRKLGKVTLTKTDKTYKESLASMQIQAGSDMVVPGAEYRVCKSNGSAVYVKWDASEQVYRYDRTSANTMMTTNENGQIVIEDVPWGSYYFEEVSAPVGYQLDTTKKYFIVSPEDDYDQYGNEIDPDSIIENVNHAEDEEGIVLALNKRDADTNAAIKGARFLLERSADGTTWDTVGYYTTDKNGRITVQNEQLKYLALGEYYRFTEISATDDYILPDNCQSAVIQLTTEAGEKDGYTVTVSGRTVTASVTMTNKRKDGELTIVKTNDNGEPLQNAGFVMYEVVGKQDEVVYTAGRPSYVPGKNDGDVVRNPGTDEPAANDILLHGYTVTDQDGKILITGTLDWSKTYYLVETKAPKGYELLDHALTFKLSDCTRVSASAQLTHLEYYVVNEKQLGEVTLIKFAGDQDGNKVAWTDAYSEDLKYTDLNDGTLYRKLNGAAFTLKDRNGNIVKNTSTTEPITVNGTALSLNDELEDMYVVNGVLHIQNLPWGQDYQLIETVVPENYAEATVKKFSIDQNHLTIQKEVIDPSKTATLTVQKQINTWEEAFGEPTFIFKVQKMKQSGADYVLDANEPVMTRMVTFHEGDDLLKSVKFDNLNENAVYQVVEIPVSRYELTSIEAVGSLDGINYATGSDIEDYTNMLTYSIDTATCQVKILSEPSPSDSGYHSGQIYNTVRYTNELKYYDNFSQNVSYPNEIEKQTMITGMYFNYNGGTLVQPNRSKLFYDFMSATPLTDDEGNTLTDANGDPVYASDALEVYVTFDDPDMADVRIYPQNHPNYDANVGYYTLAPHTDEGVTYVGADGKLYYLNNVRDEELRVQVTLTPTSNYSWATSQRTDTDFVHVVPAEKPSDVKLVFNGEPYNYNENGTEEQQVRGFFNNASSLTFVYEWDDDEKKYVINTSKSAAAFTDPVTDSSHSAYSFAGYWTDSSGHEIKSGSTNITSLDAFVSAYVNVDKDGDGNVDARSNEEMNTFYAAYSAGRAMFAQNKMSIFRGNTITAITRRAGAEPPTWATDQNKVSVSNADYPIDIWAVKDGTVVYWYTKDSHPYAPESMEEVFSGNLEMTDASSIAAWDTSLVTTMYRAFYNCTVLSDADFPAWNLSEVKTFKQMFFWCRDLESITMNIDTSGIPSGVSFEQFAGMIGTNWSGNYQSDRPMLRTVTLRGDFSNVNNVSFMFVNCGKLKTVDFGTDVDFRKVTTFQSMFANTFEKRNNGYINTGFGYFSPENFQETFQYWTLDTDSTLFETKTDNNMIMSYRQMNVFLTGKTIGVTFTDKQGNTYYLDRKTSTTDLCLLLKD